MRTTVAHRNKDVIFTKLNDRLEYLFAADSHFGLGIVPYFFITNDNGMRIVVLNQLGCLIVLEMDNGKG